MTRLLLILVLLVPLLVSASETTERRIKRRCMVIFEATYDHMVKNYKKPVSETDLQEAVNAFNAGCTSNTSPEGRIKLGAVVIKSIVDRVFITEGSDTRGKP